MTDGIHRLAIPTPFAVGRVNCWLIDDDPLTLVDTGPNSGKALDELERALAGHGRRVEDLERILLTHQHVDHEGLVAVLARRSGAEVCALDLLAPVVEDFAAAQERDDQLAEHLMLRHGIGREVVMVLRSMSRAYRGWGSAAPVARRLPDGAELPFAGRVLRVLHRPGHSPSDTLFHDAERGVLLGGDHLLAHISSNSLLQRPIGGRSGNPEDRPRPLITYLDSMRETRDMDAVEVVLPGHGEPVTDRVRLIDDRLRLHDRRAQKIRRLLADQGPRTAYEVAQALWGSVAVTQAFLTLSEALGHLDLLADRGEVSEAETGGVIRFHAA